MSELAERQWGVATRAQLLDIGVARGTVDNWLVSGRLRPLHRGVYAVGHTQLRVEGRWLAAVLAYGAGAVLSHRSALAHHGLAPIPASRIDVTAPRSRRPRAGIRLHRPLALDARDTTTHRHIPTTTIARTILDTATSRHLERVLAQAERAHLYDRGSLRDIVARNPSHPGARSLAAAIVLEPALTLSELEERMLALVRDAGLPPPAVNLPPSPASTTSNATRTSAGRRIASSSRPTARRTTTRATPSKAIAPGTRSSPRRVGASCVSPTAR